jgi:hypothetical protein
MLDPQHFIVIAGQTLVDELRRKRATIPLYGDRYLHSALCNQQEQEAKNGIRGAEIVRVSDGTYALHFDSGLQAWARIRGGMSLQAAERFARQWVSAAPTKRYAFKRRRMLCQL